LAGVKFFTLIMGVPFPFLCVQIILRIGFVGLLGPSICNFLLY